MDKEMEMLKEFSIELSKNVKEVKNACQNHYVERKYCSMNKDNELTQIKDISKSQDKWKQMKFDNKKLF